MSDDTTNTIDITAPNSPISSPESSESVLQIAMDRLQTAYQETAHAPEPHGASFGEDASPTAPVDNTTYDADDEQQVYSRTPESTIHRARRRRYRHLREIAAYEEAKATFREAGIFPEAHCMQPGGDVEALWAEYEAARPDEGLYRFAGVSLEAALFPPRDGEEARHASGVNNKSPSEQTTEGEEHERIMLEQGNKSDLGPQD